MPQPARAALLASLQRLRSLLQSALVEWAVHLRVVAEELIDLFHAAQDGSEPNPGESLDITASSSLVTDLEILRSKVAALNSRHRALHSRGRPLDILLLPDIIAEHSAPMTGTETREWALKRSLTRAEALLTAAAFELASVEALMAVALGVLYNIVRDVIAAEQDPVVQAAAELHRGDEELRREVGYARTGESVELRFLGGEELDALIVELDADEAAAVSRLVAQRDRDGFDVLEMASALGVRVARHRIIAEFFEMG